MVIYHSKNVCQEKQINCTIHVPHVKATSPVIPGSQGQGMA